MKIHKLALLVLILLMPIAAVLIAPVKAENISGEVVGPVGSYLPLVAQTEQNTWVLIKVTPDPISGFASPGGAKVSGSYIVIQTFGGTVANHSGTYLWSQPDGFPIVSFIAGRPNPGFTRWLECGLFAYPTNGETPHGATNTLLCLMHENTPGQDEFTSVHFVPDDWQEYVLPAVLYLRNHPQLETLKVTNASMVQIRSLLHNPNPYLVLTSLQLLASRKNLTTADMNAALSSTDTKVIAYSIVIAELYSWPALATNAQWLRDRITAVKSLNQLEGVAFGVSTIAPNLLDLYSIPTEDLPGVTKLPGMYGNDFGASLVPLVRQRLTELDPNGGPTDERWRNIDYICRQGEMMQKYLPKAHTIPDAGKQP
jgi:hypothetical protein